MSTRLQEELPIPLSQDALAKKADELATAEIAISSVREERRLAVRRFNEQIETLQGTLDGLAATVKSGNGAALVDVELREDWDNQTLSTWRLDTSPAQMVHERPMSEAEIARGPGLDFTPDSEEKPAEKPTAKKKRGRTKSTAEETADL